MSAGSWLFSIFAVKKTLGDWLEYHRALRDLGTYAVIIGVIVETLIDELWEIEEPPRLRGPKATTLLKMKAVRWKRFLMLFFGVVMVAGGIGVEIWQGGKADDVADNIRHLLEQDIIKAGWRQVNPSKFSELLKGKPVGQAEILYKREDTEAYLFASQIYAGLRDAGWSVKEEPRSIPSTGGDPFFANKDVPADIRYDCSSGLTIWASRDTSWQRNTAGGALKEALGFGVDRGGAMLLAVDTSLSGNHFRVVVGQNAPINVQH